MLASAGNPPTMEPSSLLLDSITSDFALVRGSPEPMGATRIRGGVNFALFAKAAKAVTLVIYLPEGSAPLLEFPLDSRFQRTGDVWHCFLSGIDPSVQYGYRIDHGPVLLDPYGKAVWGGPPGDRGLAGLRSVVSDDQFDWQYDQPLEIPMADLIIYEMHVRGFTRHESSSVLAPGTFLGLTEKIPHLQDLGIRAVELLPVAEFDDGSPWLPDPCSGEPLHDYWGYNPMAFFSPKLGYSSGADALSPVREFKEMVRRFHAAGIEVILDVVFNHTGEGGANGPALSWRAIDDSVYYLKDPRSGEYLNYSGCGNTLNCNHPVVRNQVIDCLHYWVTQMHVDGFRFDLASILGRGRDGAVLANPPLLEQIADDPILAGTKLIAEAWDAAGLYQVGSFPAYGRWAEWNGKFRDDLRRFVKGDPGMAPALATRLAGSSDLYQSSGRLPCHSVNFVTCHDGFTLRDLVSYDGKHNQRNGEDNRDGSNDNLSWNCGQEGPSDNSEVLGLRERQMRNFAALLLVSHGTPMLLAGDEFGQSQAGNNNAWCQDNEVSWLDWRLKQVNAGLFRFIKGLIRFRREHALLRRSSFVHQGHTNEIVMEWGGREPGHPDWGGESRLLTLHLFEAPARPCHERIYILANSHWEPAECRLPERARGEWRRVADSSLPSPADFSEPGSEAAIPQDRYLVRPRSVVILIHQEEWNAD